MSEQLVDLRGYLAEDRDLTSGEAADAARTVARLTDLDALVRYLPERRDCVLVYRDAHVEAWAISWMNDADTGFHDHGCSAGALHVVHGAVAEDRPRLEGGPDTVVYGAGETRPFEVDHIHRVRHVGGATALTVHVYSPPLTSMGAYEVGADGVLRRLTIPPETELRPLSELVEA